MDKAGGRRRERSSPHPLVTAAIEQAQKRVELQNFQARKRLLDYDDVMNQQREVIYSLRSFALERGEELKAESSKMVDKAMDRVVTHLLADAEEARRLVGPRGSARGTADAVPGVGPRAGGHRRRPRSKGTRPDRRCWPSESGVPRGRIEYLSGVQDELAIGSPPMWPRVLSQVMLSVLDEKWKDHLYDLDQLRNAIQYRAYGQKDPLVEYKKEAFEMFEDLMRDIHRDLHRALPARPAGVQSAGLHGRRSWCAAAPP